MSLVTGITLITNVGDPCVDEINAYLTEHHKCPLVEISDRSGGSKHPQMDVWCAGYNYFETETHTIDAFAAFVRSRSWRRGRTYTLVIQHDPWDELRVEAMRGSAE